MASKSEARSGLQAGDGRLGEAQQAGGGPRVGVVLGSDSDLPRMQPCLDTLAEFGVDSELRVLSAHRVPEDVAEYGRSAAGRGVQVLIAGAGLAAHLPGILAAYTTLPVIGVPLAVGPLGGLDALYSVVQMPPGVPVATVAVDGARNAAVLATQILAVGDLALRLKLHQFKQRLAEQVRRKDQALADRGGRKA